MTTAASLKAKAATDEVLNDAVKARSITKPKAKTETAAFPNIGSNPFTQVIFNKALSATEKRAEIAKLLTASGTKEENRAKVREFEEFKEYLQHERALMAQDIIRLTDTEVFAELKKIYDDLQGSLLDFDKKMAPLTDIIDAVYTLRTHNEHMNAFREIQEDRESEKLRETKIEGLRTQSSTLMSDMDDLRDRIDAESRNRKWFGKGDIKPESKTRIAELESKIEDIKTNLNSSRDEIRVLTDEAVAARNRGGQFAAEKKKLREMLDITGDTHKQRQVDLIGAGLNFVDTARDRIGAVRSHLGAMNGQLENLVDANGQMTQVYAVLTEGVKDASKENLQLRQPLAEAPADEDLIVKMSREAKLGDLDGHIRMLNTSAHDTLAAYGDLSAQTIRITAMKDSNDDQIAKVRNMNANGVAGVADRLSVVVQAVNSAAINESAALARDSLGAMNDRTNVISQKEVIRVASAMGERNEEMEVLMHQLEGFRKVKEEATNIVREATAEGQEKFVRMQESIKELEESIRAGREAYTGEGGDPAVKAATPAGESFGFMKR